MFSAETINKSKYRDEWNGITADFNCVINCFIVSSGMQRHTAGKASFGAPVNRDGTKEILA